MIRKKGTLTVNDGSVSLEGLPIKDGEYNYIIYDNGKNRNLPLLKYLFGVVLSEISKNLPGNPPVEVLYRYFEGMFAPKTACEIDSQIIEVADLKSSNSIEVEGVIDQIIHYAHQKWAIVIPSREDLKDSQCRELYADAYTEMWKFYLNKSKELV